MRAATVRCVAAPTAPTVITLQAGEFAAHELRLTPGVETMVRFAVGLYVNGTIEVLSHDGDAPVYFTVDGSPPAIRGRRSMVLPAAVTSTEASGNSVRSAMVRVRMISEGSPLVSVMRT